MAVQQHLARIKAFALKKKEHLLVNVRKDMKAKLVRKRSTLAIMILVKMEQLVKYRVHQLKLSAFVHSDSLAKHVEKKVELYYVIWWLSFRLIGEFMSKKFVKFRLMLVWKNLNSKFHKERGKLGNDIWYKCFVQVFWHGKRISKYAVKGWHALTHSLTNLVYGFPKVKKYLIFSSSLQR